MNLVVAASRFEYVDLDPFGSPAPYLDATLREAWDRQLVSATATDLAVLCGAYPQACRRRYGARPVRVPFRHEMAARLLMGHCAREAARYDKGIEPLLAAYAAHFVKVWFRVRRGAGRADAALAQGAYLRFDAGTGERRFTDDPRDGGPLWAGPLLEATFLDGLSATRWTGARASGIIDQLRKEVDAPALHHTTDEWAKRLRLSPPSLRRLLEALREAGHVATTTHYHARGFRTSAPADELERLVRDTAPP